MQDNKAGLQDAIHTTIEDRYLDKMNKTPVRCPVCWLIYNRHVEIGILVAALLRRLQRHS